MKLPAGTATLIKFSAVIDHLNWLEEWEVRPDNPTITPQPETYLAVVNRKALIEGGY